MSAYDYEKQKFEQDVFTRYMYESRIKEDFDDFDGYNNFVAKVSPGDESRRDVRWSGQCMTEERLDMMDMF